MCLSLEKLGQNVSEYHEQNAKAMSENTTHSFCIYYLALSLY